MSFLDELKAAYLKPLTPATTATTATTEENQGVTHATVLRQPATKTAFVATGSSAVANRDIGHSADLKRKSPNRSSNSGCSSPPVFQQAPIKEPAPGDCPKCPASSYWQWKGPGLWCFHSAYFLAKSATPLRCDEAKSTCPLSEKTVKKIC